MDILAIVITILVLASVAIGALNGLKNGARKQAIRLGFIILSLLVSVAVTGLISNTVIASVSSMSSESLAEVFDTIGYKVPEDIMSQIAENSTSISYLLAIPVAFIVAPIMFLVVYGIFHFITLIPCSILSKALVLKKSKKSGYSRLIGAAVGALQGLLIAVIVASPFTGLLSTATDAVDAIKDSGVVSFEEDSLIEGGIPTDTTLSFLGAVGGNLIYENLATVEVNGNEYNMKKELAEPVVKLVANASKLEDIESYTKLSKEDQETLNAIVNVFEESDYISDISANLILVASDTLKKEFTSSNNNMFGGEQELDNVFGKFTNSFFDVINAIATDSLNDKSSLTGDLKTLLSVYYLLSDYDILNTFNTSPMYAVEALMTTHEEEDGTQITVMKKVTDTLNSNVHTRPMVTVLSQISISALSGQFDFGGDFDITKVYNDVKESVSAISAVDRTVEETYVAEVTDILTNAFTENNVDIEAEVISDMAKYLFDNPDTISAGDGDGDGEITDDEMNKLILAYYDVYVEKELTEELN